MARRRRRRGRRRLALCWLLPTTASLRVAGNALVSETGAPVVLVGVTWSQSFAECELSPIAADEARLVRAWGHNVVRLELDENCWLAGGRTKSDDDDDETASREASRDAYREAVRETVETVVEAGMYAILALKVVDPVPNAVTAALWTSIAEEFATDEESVAFELFDEPSPAKEAEEPDWGCWSFGECSEAVNFDSQDAIGAGSLVDAVRATGAENVLLVSGVDGGNDLSQWLAYAPLDPLRNVAASMHAYRWHACSTTDCFERTLLPVLAKVPVVVTEAACGDRAFAGGLWTWLEHHNASYLLWAWSSSSSADHPDLGFPPERQDEAAYAPDDQSAPVYNPIIDEFGFPAKAEWALAWYRWLQSRRPPPQKTPHREQDARVVVVVEEAAEEAAASSSPGVYDSQEEDDDPALRPDELPVEAVPPEFLSRKVRSALVLAELFLGAVAFSYVVVHCGKHSGSDRNKPDDDEARMPLQDWLELEEDVGGGLADGEKDN
mmetsp:Transcript_2670/g.8033  ORF Transcript_2670/g.8033 Transcript_2670/m.8033 type:complete len:496 (-) Transcript_2670:265-1752(-)